MNFPLHMSCLFGAPQVFEGNWLVACRLVWKGGQGSACSLRCIARRWEVVFAGLCCAQEGLGGCLGGALSSLSCSFSRSVLLVLWRCKWQGKALHLSEGVKKMWLRTIFPLHLTNSNLLKCKFTFLILELLYFDLPSRTSVIPKVCFFSWWNNITVPPSCLFYAPAPHLCENQCIFFVCLDHEHRIGRLNCRAWQLCVRETLH